MAAARYGTYSMRYYEITVSAPGGGQLLYATSHPNGTGSPPDPGALQVELDIFETMNGQTEANSHVKLWGVGIQTISQARNYNLQNITIKGGMGKGLPLANPFQAGLIGGGQIIQAFGNWIGTDMTLDLILMPGSAQAAKAQEPRNGAFNWPANTPLAQPLKQTLQAMYPGLTVNVNISSNLTLPNDENGFYSNLGQIAQYVNNISRKIVGAATYPGVNISVLGSTVTVQDGTQQQQPIQISPLDLVGQPTWISPNTIQVTTVMRSDIAMGSYVTLPPSVVTGSTGGGVAGSASSLQNNLSFQGNLYVNKKRHVGNYKQPDGRVWVTIFDCLFTPTGGYDSNDLGPGYGMQTGPGYQ